MLQTTWPLTVLQNRNLLLLNIHGVLFRMFYVPLNSELHLPAFLPILGTLILCQETASQGDQPSGQVFSTHVDHLSRY